MKITGPNGAGSASGPRGTRPGASGGGFRLPDVGEAESASPTSGVNRTAGVMGVDALLALQDVGGPLERKRKAVRRASRILDVLDEVKLALLDGDLSLSQLERLRRAIRDERGLTDDPKLEDVLDEIELRAAVEMAKLEQAAQAA
jgi:Class II flagellar assembly regulator